MKKKLLIMIALFSWSYITSADDNSKSHSQDIEVIVDTDGEKITKKIIVNGKELSDEEIEEFEANGKMKTIYVNRDGHNGTEHQVVMIKSDDSDQVHVNKQVKVVKKSLFSDDDEEIEVIIDKDGENISETIIVNGKELSLEEIEEFKASGKMKVIHLDTDIETVSGHKMMFFDAESEFAEDIDIDIIMEKVGDLQGLDLDESSVQEWISEDGKNVKIIKNSIFTSDDNNASLGLVANVESDGWHLTKIMEKSGAKDAGILVGDIVKSIDGISMLKEVDRSDMDYNKLPKFDDGEIVKVVIERAGQEITFDVQARLLDKSAMQVDLMQGAGGNYKWVEQLHNDVGDLSKIKVMVFDGKDGDFKLNTDDIHMVFPEKLDKMNFFISDGKSTSKLLGKHHEMSSMSDGLSKYFNTQGGVLVLHVDDANVFNLQDGDVIKSVNGYQVESPKDVIKQIINVDAQEDIEMKVVRDKQSKTLKYQK